MRLLALPLAEKTPVREGIRKSGSPRIDDFSVYERYTARRLQKVVLDWIKRLKLVIQNQGEYFEKLQH